MTRRRYGPVRMLVWFVEALLIGMAFLYLSEYFGWNWRSEAGGAVERRSTPPV